MKTMLMAFILASSAFGAQKSAVEQAQVGCGPNDIRFDAQTDKGQRPLGQPEPGKALLYFIEDDTNFLSTPKPTTRLGIDGNWAGANHGSSYFYVALEPGEHHLCASWQSRVVIFAGQQAAAAHLIAEAGKSYYFSVQNFWTRDSNPRITFGPLDSDEAQLLMSKFSFSSSHSKK